MGAYENAICEEGTREELIEHFLKARSENATLTAALAEARGALEKIGDEENYGMDGAWDADSYPDEIANAALATINAAEKGEA